MREDIFEVRREGKSEFFTETLYSLIIGLGLGLCNKSYQMFGIHLSISPGIKEIQRKDAHDPVSA